MLDQLGRHGGFDLTVQATGDLHIDTHHTVEDVAITLGEAFREALGDKAGIRRFASGQYPLDEALVEIALDISGRPFVAWDVELPESLPLGNPAFDPQLAEHAVSLVRHQRRPDAARDEEGRPQRAPHHRGDVQGPRPQPPRRRPRRQPRRRPLDQGRPVSVAAPIHLGGIVSGRDVRTPRRFREMTSRERPLVAVVDYGIGNLHSAHKALERLGRRRPPDGRRRADRRRRRRRAAGGRGVRGVHGRPARAAPRSAGARRRGVGAAVPRDLRRRADAVRPQRGDARRRRARRHRPAPWRGCPTASSARRCSGTGSTSSTPTSRCSPGSASGRGSTSSTRCTASPTTRRSSPRRATTAVTVNAAFRAGNVFAAQFHPEKSASAGLGLLGNFVTSLAVRLPRDAAVPVDRPARRPRRAPGAGRLRRRDGLRRRPGGRGDRLLRPGRGVDPRRRPRRRPHRRAASTARPWRPSWRPSPGGRTCRPAVACARSTTPGRSPTPASPAS